MIDEKQRSRLKKYKKRMTALENERQTFEDQWISIQEYMLPLHSLFLGGDDDHSNRGKRKDGKIINGIAGDSLDTLAAGMVGGVCSQARPWLRFGINDKELAEYGPVREWLTDTRDRILMVFSKSNFYSAAYNVFLEMGGFGTGCMLVEEDFDTIIRCRPFTVGEYFVATDSRYQPNSLYRKVRMSCHQLAEKFGEDALPMKVKELIKLGNGDETQIVYHAIQPRDYFDKSKHDPLNMAFESIYWMDGTDEERTILRESGYNSIPFAAPRWHVRGTNSYGYSPAMRGALGDCKMLQKLEESQLDALAKMVDPPMNAPSSMEARGGVSIAPGGLNFYDAVGGTNSAGLTPAYQVTPRTQEVEFKIDRVEQRIRRSLYNDLFLSIINQGKQMTAREVIERTTEKMQVLGPVLQRVHSEFLDVVIDRTWTIMERLDLLPEAPKEIEGQDIKIEYISILAQAQKMSGVTSLEQVIGFTGNLAAVDPGVLDKIDMDETVDRYADMVGVPPSIIRDDREVAEIRAQRQEQQQAQQMREQMSQGAVDAKTLSEANTGENNALTELIGGIGE